MPRKKQNQEPEPEKLQDDESQEIDLAASSGEEELEASPPEETELTRKEKQQRRYDELLRDSHKRAEALEEENKGLKSRFEEQDKAMREMRENMARLQGGYEALNKPKEDTLQSEIDKTWDEQQTVLQAVQRDGVTAEEVKGAITKARELEARRTRLIIQQEQQTAARNAPRSQPELDLLKAQYPDVLGDTKGVHKLAAIVNERKANNENINYQVLSESLEQTRTWLRGGNQDVSDAKRATAGIPRGGSDSGKSTKVTLTPLQIKMAEDTYPDLPRDEALKKWAARYVKVTTAQ